MSLEGFKKTVADMMDIRERDIIDAVIGVTAKCPGCGKPHVTRVLSSSEEVYITVAVLALCMGDLAPELIGGTNGDDCS
jgi:hypothetical protein